jgi:hypothetical protein
MQLYDFANLLSLIFNKTFKKEILQSSSRIVRLDNVLWF